jgi:DNA-binding GntR family transcriptional regulator
MPQLAVAPAVTSRPPVSQTFPHIRVPWRAIHAEIAYAVEHDMVPGEPVGTTAEVAALYSVNPKTARKALVALAGEGLITVKRGRGYFVPEAG